MSFHPAAMTTADRQSLEDRFGQALQAVAGEQPSPSSQWFAEVLGTSTDTMPAPGRQFKTLSDKQSRQMLWRLLSAQLNMDLSLWDALESLKTYDFRNIFPEDMPELIQVWQEGLKKEGYAFDFFLAYVAPVDFQQGLRMALTCRTASIQQALQREAR